MNPNPIHEAEHIRVEVRANGTSGPWDGTAHPNAKAVEQFLARDGIGFSVTDRTGGHIVGQWIPMPGGTRHFADQLMGFRFREPDQDPFGRQATKVTDLEEAKTQKAEKTKAARLGKP